MFPELVAVAVVTAAPSPVDVLHHWDERRAAAWSRGDPVALRALYTAGSATGRADVVMLRAWDRRGLRLEGLEVQLLAVEVRRRPAGRLVLEVTDRVADGVATPGGLSLPRDRATSHVVTMRRVAGEWRVAEVRPARP